MHIYAKFNKTSTKQALKQYSLLSFSVLLLNPKILF